MDNAEKIRAWRVRNLSERITVEALLGVLGTDTLRGVDLRGAILYNADLWGADLKRANLQGANLKGADLQYADLRGANLQGANLRHTNLYGSCGGHVLQLAGIYPYPVFLVPTPDGWELTVGCWTGTVAGLRKLAAQDDGWPEAEGAEIVRRRPLLYAIADMCDVHIANNPNLIENLSKRWSAK